MRSRLLLLFFLLVSLISGVSFAESNSSNPLSYLMGARIWPAQDYTRLTFEARGPLRWNVFTVDSPERLVLDLEGIEPNAVTEALSGRVRSDDPWVKSIRVGRFKPGILRVVLDLKSAVKPSSSLLEPVGDYGYRLVLDIYPAEGQDPLLALLQSREHNTLALNNETALSQGSSVNEVGSPSTAGSSVGSSGTSQANGKPNTTHSPSSGGGPAKPIAVKPMTKPSEPESNEVQANEFSNPTGSEKLITIAVDAGHGGEDPGAHGEGGTLEKEVTLAIAKRVKAFIDAEPGMRAVLVRDGDYFIPLMGRTSKARQLKADVFVSIHADAFINRDAKGSSVFILSERGASSVAARWLANKENQADLIGGVNIHARDPYLAQTLFDLSQTATIQDSQRLARYVLKELSGLNRLHKGEVEQAGFAVLKSPDIPSILVETAFITNPDEEKRLSDERYRDDLAHTLVRGLKKYLMVHPPLGKARLSAVDRSSSDRISPQ